MIVRRTALIQSFGEYIKDHPFRNNITYVNQPENLGANLNFANALNCCKGKYIALCEGDDFWVDPCKMSNQLQVLENNSQYSMVCTNRVIVDGSGVKLTDNFYEKEVYVLSDVIEGFIPGTKR